MDKFKALLALGLLIACGLGLPQLHAQTQRSGSQEQPESKPVRAVRFSLTDSITDSLTDLAKDSAIDNDSNSMDRLSEEAVEQPEYPDCVSTDPGFPRKPLWERPGDFNGSQCMSPRYCQTDFFRAGWPRDQRKRAVCSMNDHYFAWYVGGGAGLPFLKSRHRTQEEGTWGLDYSLWKKPRTVWMKWTCGRYQGGEGAYATDHEPRF